MREARPSLQWLLAMLAALSSDAFRSATVLHQQPCIFARSTIQTWLAEVE